MKIKTKAILAVLGSTLVCLAIFATFAIKQTRVLLIDAAVAQLNAVADSRASQITVLIANFREKTSLIASRDWIRDLLNRTNEKPDSGDQVRWLGVLSDAVKSDISIESISIVDAHGSTILSTVSMAAEPDRSNKPPTFEYSGESEPYEMHLVSKVFTVINEDKARIVCYVPIHSGEHLLGAVLMQLSPSVIEQVIASADFARTGEVILGLQDNVGAQLLITASGRIPGREFLNNVRSRQLRLPILHAFNRHNETLTGDAQDYDGAAVIAVTRYLEESGWGLTATVHSSEVLGAFAAVKHTLLGFATLLSLVVLAGTKIFSMQLKHASARLNSELNARKAAEGRFAEMFNSAPTAMLMINTNGNIVHANNQAETLLDYARNTLLGMKVEALVPEHIRDGHEALRSGYSNAPSTRAMGANRDLNALRSDGAQVPVEIGLTPIETKDGPMVLVALVDLSERKAAESALQEWADALARSNRELDDFAYVASHDLKAPLRAIEQLATFVMEDAADVLPDQSLTDLRTLQSRVVRMDGLLDDLLQYARIGREGREPEQLDTAKLILEAAELYVPAERFQIAIASEMPSIHVPRTAAEIVFRNLLMNVVKHHDKENGQIHVDWQYYESNLQIFVSDDGPGIDLKYKDRIFGLFQTLQSRDKVEGSGIGLALVRKTIEAHGGSIDLVPGKSRGACFRLCWQVHPAGHRKAA